MDQKIKFLIILLIIIFVFGFSINRYIADISTLEKVKISVENTSIQDLTLTYCELKLNVVISNPISIPISEFSAKYNITIANTNVGNGNIPAVTIPAKSQIRRSIFLKINYADVGNAVIEGIQTKTFDVTINGLAKGNIFFNLISISKPISASYSFS